MGSRSAAAASVREKRILNRGSWLLPSGPGEFRTGATYDWKELDCEPTKRGRRGVERRLRQMMGKVRYEVTGHEAAVRPMIDGRRICMGRHPSYPQVCFFNGLGSKGVLDAPFFANMLAAHLVGEGEIEGEADVGGKG